MEGVRHARHSKAGHQAVLYLIDEVGYSPVLHDDANVKPAKHGSTWCTRHQRLLHAHQRLPGSQRVFLKFLLCILPLVVAPEIRFTELPRCGTRARTGKLISACLGVNAIQRPYAEQGTISPPTTKRTTPVLPPRHWYLGLCTCVLYGSLHHSR